MTRRKRRDQTAQCQVTFRIDGTEHRFPADPSATLLESALEHGLELPFGCMVGGCGRCQYRLIAGQVDYVQTDRRSTLVLTCVARPLSASVLLEGQG